VYPGVDGIDEIGLYVAQVGEAAQAERKKASSGSLCRILVSFRQR